jgi:hypothetical protein
MNATENILSKINNAKALDFGTIFSAAIELFKKTWIQGFLLQLFTVIVMLPLIIILYIPLFTFAFAQMESGYGGNVYSDFFAGASILYLLFVFVGMFVLGAVSVALNAAFYRIMKMIDHNEPVETADFFYFLKGKYLSKTFMLVLISILISIPAALLCYIPFIYVIVPMSYFAIIFAFNPEMSVGDIVKISFKLGNKKWLLSFGLLFVAGLLAEIVGFLLCGIGTLFTMAFVYHPVYLIYKDVVGFNQDSSLEIVDEYHS